VSSLVTVLRAPTSRTIIIAAAVLVFGALSACGSDSSVSNLRPTTIAGSAGTEAPGIGEPAPPEVAPVEPVATDPTPVDPAPVDPAPVDPAPVDPAPVDPAPVDPGPNPVLPDTDDGIDTLVVVLIIGGFLLAALAIGALMSRSKKSATSRGTSTASSPSPQSSLLSTSQWITDQLALELMASPPAAALQRWTTERSRLDNVAIGAQQQYLDTNGINWQSLGQTMSALAASIDTNLALRAQDPPNAQLINESTDVVNRHRAAIQQLGATLLPTIDH